MYMVDIKYNELGSIDLDQIKEVITNHISSFKKYWLQKDNIESLKVTIRKKNTFSEIFNFIK